MQTPCVSSSLHSIPAYALLFPGQGTDLTGRGRRLISSYPTLRPSFELAEEIAGFDIVAFTDAPDTTKTTQMQVSLVTLCCTAASLLEETACFPPRFVAGHSLGELSALICAGALSFDDGIRCALFRGQAIKKAWTACGAMTALFGLSFNETEALCREVSRPDSMVFAANDNSPTQVVASGHTSAIERLEALLEKRSVQFHRLAVAFPFHTPLLAQASEDFGTYLTTIAISQPRWPVISNLSGIPYTTPDDIRRSLGHHISSPVLWGQSMNLIVDQKVRHTLELGPGETLTRLVRRSHPSVTAHAVDAPSPTLLRQLSEPLSLSQCLSVRRALATTPNRGANDLSIALDTAMVEAMRSGGYPPEAETRTKLRAALAAKHLPEDQICSSLKSLDEKVIDAIPLIGFSHAGGSSAFYRSWHCPCATFIDYPGHGTNAMLPQARSMDELVDFLIRTVRWPNKYRLFGHSLGAYVVFEVVQQLLTRHLPLPEQCVLSAALPPTDDHWKSWLSTSDDQQAVSLLESMGGTPPNLANDKEIASHFLGLLRSDMQLLANYVQQTPQPISVPLLVCYGTDDRYVPADRVEGWRRLTTRQCEIVPFPGNHFSYLFTPAFSTSVLTASHSEGR